MYVCMSLRAYARLMPTANARPRPQSLATPAPLHAPPHTSRFYQLSLSALPAPWLCSLCTALSTAPRKLQAWLVADEHTMHK